MSIIGESFEDYVQSQIFIRQQLHGKKKRTNEDLEVLSNQNAWIKLASSVEIVLPKTKEELEKVKGEPVTQQQYEEYSRNWGDDKLKAIGLTNTDRFLGIGLAKKAVLFNTLSEVNPTKYDGDKVTQKGSYNQRAGVLSGNAEVWNDNFAYGLGGTTFGIVPPPGIESASVQCKNRGSIREATVQLKAQNKFQFELIELLYLRLGYSMMLEWGWDKYKNREDKLATTGNTIIEDKWFTWREKSFLDVLTEIEATRKKYDGNYDGFLGKVVNFDWKFLPDGTYDITLKLITVGDVIESLTVNLPQELKSLSDIKKEMDEASATVVNIGSDAPLISGATTSTLAYNLFQDVITNPERWKGGENSEYFGLYGSILNEVVVGKAGQTPFEIAKTVATDEELNTDRFNYYLTFRELLNKVRKFCIPSINQKKILGVNNDDDNICSIYPYQVSLDPKVALVKPGFQQELTFISEDDYKSKETGIVGYWQWMKALKEFAVFEEKGAIYGKTMDIYLNYDFVSSVLNDTTNNGEIKVFSFLKKICDGINSAMGGLMKLEPILTDDRLITIIDQNPILGIQNSENYGDRFQVDQVEFELFGYNPQGSVTGSDAVTQTSNFVRDFSFQTTIGPNIASMITIGATAEGVKTKNYDGTGFANWNKGLVDRYQIKYRDPDLIDENNTSKIKNPAAPMTAKQLEEIYKKFLDSEVDEYLGIWPWKRRSLGKKYKNFGLEAESRRDIDDCPVTGENFGNYTWTEYSNWVRDWVEENNVKDVEEQKFAGQYINWLAQAFGGKINNLTINEFAYYYLLNGDFITQGKQLFKAFANTLNNKVYEITGQPSNSAGFIPVGLDITNDGLSGVKIYNGIAIRQEFLPPAYPTSLQFVISQVNHEISNDDWTTNLKTISTANTKNSNPQESGLFKNIVADIGVENLTETVVYAGSEPKVTLTSGYSVENPRAWKSEGLIYYPEVTNKKQIVLHHTAGFANPRQEVKGWREGYGYAIATHWIIDRESRTGKIAEHVFGDKFWSNHIGSNHYNNKALNKMSLSIELTSIGWLTKMADGKYKNYTGGSKTVEEYGGVSQPYKFDSNGNIVPMTEGYRGKNYFQSYTVAQLKELNSILKNWNSTYNINIKVDRYNFNDVFTGSNKLSNKAISMHAGIYTHNSYRTDKIDVFPQKELLEMLNTGKDPVSIKTV